MMLEWNSKKKAAGHVISILTSSEKNSELKTWRKTSQPKSDLSSSNKIARKHTANETLTCDSWSNIGSVEAHALAVSKVPQKKTPIGIRVLSVHSVSFKEDKPAETKTNVTRIDPGKEASVVVSTKDAAYALVRRPSRKSRIPIQFYPRPDVEYESTGQIHTKEEEDAVHEYTLSVMDSVI